MKLSFKHAIIACHAVPLPDGKRNQWKRDTKGTHRRIIPVQTPPYRGSIREAVRNARMGSHKEE